MNIQRWKIKPILIKRSLGNGGPDSLNTRPLTRADARGHIREQIQRK